MRIRPLFSHIARTMSSSKASPVVNREYDAIQLALMDEQCIAVDNQDKIVGCVSKKNAHQISTMTLHRAFSVFAFTPSNRLILQRRSSSKITFPDLWTNTCCSHPLHTDQEMDGEIGVKRAAIRKLKHELGLENISEDQLTVMGRYLYKASMSDSPWGEHELDYGVILRDIDMNRLRPNPEEVQDVCDIDGDNLDRWIQTDPAAFSPWFTLFVGQSHLSSWWSHLDSLQQQRNMNIVHMN